VSARLPGLGRCEAGISRLLSDPKEAETTKVRRRRRRLQRRSNIFQTKSSIRRGGFGPGNAMKTAPRRYGSTVPSGLSRLRDGSHLPMLKSFFPPSKLPFFLFFFFFFLKRRRSVNWLKAVCPHRMYDAGRIASGGPDEASQWSNLANACSIRYQK
jgi:hypothetical protein